MPSRIRPLKIRPLRIRPLRIRPLRIRPLKIRPLKIRPLRIRPLSNRPHGVPAPVGRLLTRADQRVPTPETFTSPLHDRRLVARLGVWLGSTITLCFVTGVLSHYQQHPVPWLPLGPDPAWGYRLTQGAHVVTGCASVPLLLAKLYAAYPRLFERPPVRGVLHGVERAGIAVLVAATSLELVTGVMNVAQWYPWGFGFVPVHHALAWLVIGALAVHLAVKLPVVREALAAPLEGPDPSAGDRQDTAGGPAPVSDERPATAGGSSAASDEPGSRRGFLVAALGSAAAVALFTAGQTVRPLRGLGLLAPRRPDVGPQGLPVNRTAAGARVTAADAGPGWRLELTGPTGTRRLDRTALAALPQAISFLPIACVEGWGAGAEWEGVPMAELVRLAGGGPDDSVLVESLERGGVYRTSVLPPEHAADVRTLLALRLNGGPLHLDHGAPARIIAPNRPGVLQTKWVGRLTVLPGDRARG